MRTTLRKEVCRECNTPILVAPYRPHPDIEYATGMPATRWDDTSQQEYHVGWICEKCAFSMIGEGFPSSISGGPDLEFHY